MPIGVYKRTKEHLQAMSDVRIGKPLNGCRKGRIEHRGYIFIRNPKHPTAKVYKYVREHRLIMEKKVGRYLHRQEVVHHINGIKTDNRVSNLMLLKNEKEHQAMHRFERAC